MRKLLVVLIATIIIQLGMQYANACGDKTMRVRTGLRFYQLRASKQPSSILIHSSALPPGEGIQLRDRFIKIGYKATTVDDIGHIDNDLKTTHYDLIFTNLAEAPNVQRQVNSLTPKTVVVPVLFKQPKSEERAASKQYKVIMKNPTDMVDFLNAVVAVMDLQSKKS